MDRPTDERVCSVAGCSNNSISNPEVSFFLIPLAETDTERRMQWLKLISCEDIILQNDSQRQFYVCEKHFDSGDIKLVNNCKHLMDVNVAPRFFLNCGDVTRPCLTDEESETTKSQKRSGSMVIKTYAKKRRVEFVVDSKVKVEEDNTEEGFYVGAGPSQAALHTAIYIKDELHNEESELNHGSKGLTEEESDEKQCGDNNEAIPNYYLFEELEIVNEDKKNQLAQFCFKGKQELLVPLPNDAFGFFELLMMRDEMLKIILDNTNEAAADKWKRWVPITIKEFKILIGLLIHMGTFNFKRISDFWRTDRLFKTRFGRYIEQNRFMTILKYFRITSGEQISLASFQPVLDHFNRIMNESYRAGKELLVDESVWPQKEQKSRSTFLNLFDSEESKGPSLKVYLLREPCGTVVKFHLEKSTNKTCKSFQEVLLEMAQDNLDAGHSVYLLDHQTSHELATKLLARKTHCTGKFSKRSLGVPESIAIAQLGEYESISVINEGIQYGKWAVTAKQEVTYLNTEFPDETVSVVNDKGKQVTLPKAFVEMCNKTEFKLTKLLAEYYPCFDQPISWQVKLFVYVLMLSLVNAHRLYNKFSSSHMDFSRFRMEVIKNLLPDVSENDDDTETPTLCHRLERIPSGENEAMSPMTDCKTCYAVEKKYIATIYQCRACPGAPGMCVKCFCDIHC